MSDDLGNLVMYLNSAGKSLVDPTFRGIKPLRDLKDNVLPGYIGKVFSAETRSYSFFLLMFLDDVFCNLAGDFPQAKTYGEAVDNIRRDFFKTTGDGLSELAQTIESGDSLGVFKQLSLLVTTYLDSIEMINEKIERSCTQ
jgi:hypothetical protein